VTLYFLGASREQRNVSFVTSTHRTALAFAYLIHDAQLALLVDVESDYPEKFGFD
jgi:hypothetical protein